MAIQVGGTTVIDNSRNLQNVGGLKTINSTSIVGSGNIEAGASTSYGAVGTYVLGTCQMGRTQEGTTKSGSSIRITGGYAPNAITGTNSTVIGGSGAVTKMGDNTLSGTWRMMFDASQDTNNTFHRFGLWVRVS